MARVEAYVSEMHEKRRQRRMYIFFGTIFGVVILVVLFVALVLFRAPFLKYSKIEVVGTRNVSEAEIIQLFFASYSHHSSLGKIFGLRSFLAWPDKLGAEDLKLLPTVEAVSVHKHYVTRKLVLDVTERLPVGVWCDASDNTGGTPTSGTSCFWFDGSGIIFKRAAFVGEGNLMKVVSDYSGRNLVLGDEVLGDALTPNFISIFRVLSASGVKVREVALHSLDREEIEVSTHEGPKLYFSLRFSAANDLAVLQSMKARPDFAKLQYVDFRVENRVYYK